MPLPFERNGVKKIVVLGLLAMGLWAGQYAKLKDGTVIILKDDGTWEKVQTLPQNAEVAPPPQLEKSATAKPQVDPNAKIYAEHLQGRWESLDGKLVYIVTADKVVKIENGKKISDDYQIKVIDADKRLFLLNVGEGEKIGPFSFGGYFRKMAFNRDFSELTDYSASIPTKLYKK